MKPLNDKPFSDGNLLGPHPLESITGVPSLLNELTERLIFLYKRGLTMSATTPARKITRNYLTLSGQISSGKDNLPKFFEGPLESDFYMMLDFDWLVDRFNPQPVTISYMDPTGLKREYTPDTLIFFKTGAKGARNMKPILAEVKTRESIAAEGDLHVWQAKAGDEYARNFGWRYRVFTQDDIHVPYTKNAKFLRRFRYETVDRRYYDPMADILHDVGELEIQELVIRTAALLSPQQSDVERRNLQLSMLPTLWHAITRDLFYANLEQRLEMNSKVKISRFGDLRYSPFK